MLCRIHEDTRYFHLTGYTDTGILLVTGDRGEGGYARDAKGGTHGTDVRPGAHAAPDARDRRAGRSSQEARAASSPLAAPAGAVVNPARMAPAAAKRALVRAARRAEAELGRSPERNPDERGPLDTLDAWILFGPRVR
jgi:succinate dehydrogenase/fumarate reductase flavoprotein subunit